MKAAQRQRSSLVWLAILTIAAVGVVRAEGSLSNPAPYTQSMLRFLAAHQDSDVLAAGVPGLLERWSGEFLARATKANPNQTQSDFLLSMLPVVFVGLATTLSLKLTRLQLIPVRSQAAPLTSCYKRPPPQLA